MRRRRQSAHEKLRISRLSLKHEAFSTISTLSHQILRFFIGPLADHIIKQGKWVWKRFRLVDSPHLISSFFWQSPNWISVISIHSGLSTTFLHMIDTFSSNFSFRHCRRLFNVINWNHFLHLAATLLVGLTWGGGGNAFPFSFLFTLYDGAKEKAHQQCWHAINCVSLIISFF